MADPTLPPPPDRMPNPESSISTPSIPEPRTRWWLRPVLTAPVWAWIVIAALAVVAIAGAAGPSDDNEPEVGSPTSGVPTTARSDRDASSTPTTSAPTTVEESSPTTSEDDTSSPGHSDSPGLHLSSAIEIPAGTGSDLEVVMMAPTDGSSVPVVVRNNTSEVVYRIELSGTARDDAGTLVASGSSQRVAPSYVQPGEWAFASVYFGMNVLDGDETFDFNVTSSGSGPGFFGGSVDLEVTEAEYGQGDFTDRIIGIVANRTDGTVSGPVSVDVACFADGNLVDVFGSFTDGDDIGPGSSDSFTVDLYGLEATCDVFAVGASGYDF